METGFWRVRDASSDPRFDPLTFDSVSLLKDCCLWRGQRPRIRAVRPNNRTAVSKETRAKNIKSLYQKEREETAREK